MADRTPTSVLGEEIQTRLAEYSKKRVRDKRKAFGLRIGAAVLSAAVTVLLGLKVSDGIENVLKNAALVTGALVAILNAWDAFYDHRALWVKRTTTVARLKKLQRSYNQATARQAELSPKELTDLTASLEQILDDDLSSWVQMRSEGPARAGAADAAAANG